MAPPTFQAMTSLLVTANALLLGGGCFLDPTCTDSCDGTKIASCKWKCSGSGKLDVDECHREYGGTDCAAQVGPTGNPMACRMFPVQGGPPTPGCIDVALPRCQPVPGNLFCTTPHSIASCQMTTEGGYATPESGSYCTNEPGLECHAASFGVNCVDSPKVACNPATHPRCLDEETIVFCLGREGEGFYQRTTRCGNWRCEGSPGAAACR